MTKHNIQKRNVARGKTLERETAKELEVFGAYRIKRMGDWGESKPDVKFDHVLYEDMIIDCKKYKKMRHHSLLRECKEKYCPGELHPILVTEEFGAKEKVVVMEMRLFKELLEHYQPV